MDKVKTIAAGLGTKLAMASTGAVGMLAGVASASDASSSGGDISAVTGAVSTVGTLMGGVLNMITGNPILVVFFAASFIGVGVAVFKKVKGASKG